MSQLEQLPEELFPFELIVVEEHSFSYRHDRTVSPRTVCCGDAGCICIPCKVVAGIIITLKSLFACTESPFADPVYFKFTVDNIHHQEFAIEKNMLIRQIKSQRFSFKDEKIKKMMSHI